MLRYIINPFLSIILSVAMLHHVVANDKRSRTIIWPTTCYLGLDLAKTCVGWYQKSGPAYEINGSLDFGPILFDADYGFGKIQRDGRKHKGSFSSARGPYFRIGLGYNFLTPTPHHNQFFIGCRYARSFFDFELKSDKLQCDHPPTDDCSKQCTPPPAHFGHRAGDTIVHWWEVVAGGKVSLISLLSIGCTVRYKFRKKIENNLSTLPFDIPGFGLGEFDHAFGYSGYVLLRIPLRKSNSASYPPLMQKSGA